LPVDRKAYQKAYREKNREALNAKQRERGKLHYQANKEQYRAKAARWKALNPTRAKELAEAHRAKNRERLRKRSAEWYADNREKAALTTRRTKLRLYGLTPDQFEALLRKQDFECAICLRMLTKPVVDHQHGSKLTRGILCRQCNTALGLLGDNTDNLERAIEHLSIVRIMKLRKWLSGVTSTTSSGPLRGRSTNEE
jgi:hypothetical protein